MNLPHTDIDEFRFYYNLKNLQSEEMLFKFGKIMGLSKELKDEKYFIILLLCIL